MTEFRLYYYFQDQNFAFVFILTRKTLVQKLVFRTKKFLFFQLHHQKPISDFVVNLKGGFNLIYIHLYHRWRTVHFKAGHRQSIWLRNLYWTIFWLLSIDVQYYCPIIGYRKLYGNDNDGCAIFCAMMSINVQYASQFLINLCFFSKLT